MIIQLYTRTTKQTNGNEPDDKDSCYWQPVTGKVTKLANGRSGLSVGDVLVVPKPLMTDRLGKRREIIITSLFLSDIWATYSIEPNPTPSVGMVTQVASIHPGPEHNYIITDLDGRVFAIHSATATYSFEFDEGNNHG